MINKLTPCQTHILISWYFLREAMISRLKREKYKPETRISRNVQKKIGTQRLGDHVLSLKNFGKTPIL